jgi:hypothetical protein
MTHRQFRTPEQHAAAGRPSGLRVCGGQLGVRTLLRRGATGVLAALALLGAACSVSAATASALSAGRVYELVSPVYKGGYGASHIEAVAPNGESVAFFSPGVFAGAPMGLANTADSLAYVAHRGATGWSTESVLPPAALMTFVNGHDVSATLASTLAEGKLGPNLESADQEGAEAEFLLHPVGSPDTAAGWEAGGPVLEALKKSPTLNILYQGASPDLCHLVFFDRATSEALLPEPAGAPSTHLYEFARGCAGEPSSLRFVAVNNVGKLISPACAESLGIEEDNLQDRFNAIAADGREIFFTTQVNSNCGGPAYQLFVRVGGVRTLEVSRPLAPACVEVPCGGAVLAAERASANFAGASRDGSKVFFTTNAPLVAGDKDEGSDLYMATIGCPSGEGEACAAESASTEVTSLTQVSSDPHAGEAAEVQGVVRVAPDGSRVYFVAHGVLGEGSGLEGATPLAGADNLYVYDAVSGRVAFIADLCSGPGASGTVEDVRCPADLGEGRGGPNDMGLWAEYEAEAQTAGVDGAFLVFASYGQLVAGDTDTARDIYRYDAETGGLERVSIGEGGYDANGNDSAFDASIAVGHLGGTVKKQYEMDNRAISEDGSRIVFTTAEPLSPDASNGLQNVYEWHQEQSEAGGGHVSLISSGSGDQPVSDVAMDTSGQDVFFVTAQGLVPQDTDGAPDVYDARLGGGFPTVAASPQECAGDACQGPLTNPAPLLVPGSAVQAPSEVLAPTTTSTTPSKPRQKPKKTRKAAKRKSKRRGRRAVRNKTTTRGRGR